MPSGDIFPRKESKIWPKKFGRVALIEVSLVLSNLILIGGIRETFLGPTWYDFSINMKRINCWFHTQKKTNNFFCIFFLIKICFFNEVICLFYNIFNLINLLPSTRCTWIGGPVNTSIIFNSKSVSFSPTLNDWFIKF